MSDRPLPLECGKKLKFTPGERFEYCNTGYCLLARSSKRSPAVDPELGLVVSHSGGWPGYYTWYERFIDADKVLIHIRCRSTEDARAFDGFLHGMEAIARGKESEPVQCIEDAALKSPDKSGWDALCGKYDTSTEEGLLVEEVFQRGGRLFAVLLNTEAGSRTEAELFPLGENTFGIRQDTDEIVFSDKGVAFGDEPCRKL